MTRQEQKRGPAEERGIPKGMRAVRSGPRSRWSPGEATEARTLEREAAAAGGQPYSEHPLNVALLQAVCRGCGGKAGQLRMPTHLDDGTVHSRVTYAFWDPKSGKVTCRCFGTFPDTSTLIEALGRAAIRAQRMADGGRPIAEVKGRPSVIAAKVRVTPSDNVYSGQ